MALLDVAIPGWHSSIDLKTLSLSSCNRCVLGQVYGYYDDGLEVLGFDPHYDGGGEFGFESEGESYADLTAEWDRQIRAALGASK